MSKHRYISGHTKSVVPVCCPWLPNSMLVIYKCSILRLILHKWFIIEVNVYNVLVLICMRQIRVEFYHKSNFLLVSGAKCSHMRLILHKSFISEVNVYNALVLILTRHIMIDLYRKSNIVLLLSGATI